MPPRDSRPDPALAAAVRHLRAERGISQEDAAHDARLTTSAYARVERGQVNPTWSTVRQVAAGLRVTLRELVDAVEAEGRKR